MAKVPKEMEAAENEGRLAEEKRRPTEIAALKAEHLQEKVFFEKNIGLIAQQSRN